MGGGLDEWGGGWVGGWMGGGWMGGGWMGGGVDGREGGRRGWVGSQRQAKPSMRTQTAVLCVQ